MNGKFIKDLPIDNILVRNDYVPTNPLNLATKTWVEGLFTGTNFNNGLSASGGVVKFGGALTQHTAIDGNFNFQVGEITQLAIASFRASSLRFNGMIWPSADGSAGQLLSTNGSNGLQWITGFSGLSALKVFYVDSNNVLTGDGSVINPFNTLDLALNAVLGAGTRANPDKQNMTIVVAGGTYTTAINLAINTTTWIFQAGTTVTYTGTGFLFDISGLGTSSSTNVFGLGNFTTSTGAFINSVGTSGTSSGNARILRFECNSLTSTVNNTVSGDSKPLISCSNDSSGLNGQSTGLILTINQSISSSTQKILKVRNRASIEMNGNNATTSLSIGSFSIGNNAADAHIFDIGATYTTRINNFILFAYSTDAYIKIGQAGSSIGVGLIEIADIIVRTTTSAYVAERFLQIGDIATSAGMVYTEVKVIFRNIDYSQVNFSDKTKYFEYIGANLTFEYLELYNSRTPYPIDPKILLNKTILTTGSSPADAAYTNIQAENTIDGLFNLSNIQEANGSFLTIDANGNVSKTGANIGIGVTTADASAIVDITSTTKGFLPPRMTTVEKAAIVSPAAGLVVYDTTLNKLCVYTTAWETITSS